MFGLQPDSSQTTPGMLACRTRSHSFAQILLPAVAVAIALFSRSFAQDADFPAFELPRLSDPEFRSPSKEDRSRRTPLIPADDPAERDRRLPSSRDRVEDRDPDRNDTDRPTPLDPISPGELDDLRNFGAPPSDGRRLADEERSVLPPDTQGRFPVIRPRRDEAMPFDWTQQTVSIADIEVGRNWTFEHDKATLTDAETLDYVHLIRAVENKRTTRPYVADGVNVTSLWEASFYRFAQVRRQAWSNGALMLYVKSSDLADPFAANSDTISATDELPNSSEPDRYSLEMDMRAHPKDFVGRPIVMYGLFRPRGVRELQAARSLDGEAQVYQLRTGLLRNLQDTQTIAMVDAAAYVDSQSQTEPSQAWPSSPIAIPVVVKGWYVKRWQGQPLIYTDVLRILTPKPYDRYIQSFVRSKQPVSDDEAWLYYETLRQLQVTSGDVQSALALTDQNERVQELVAEAKQQAVTDLASLENQLRSGKMTREGDAKTPGFETLRRRIERQIDLRVRRADQHLKAPETFPMFVDLFDDPDRWQGHLISLRGHVRRISRYDGDSTLFDGQTLYELWLFPPDSMHNPAVIITPSVPRDFPVNADLVDGVSLTGCFFKMYRYRGQEKIRPAPLILAGRISWNPTPEHVLKLVKAGHVPASAPIVSAAQSQSRQISDTAILVIGFFTLIAAMTLWGRVQRDRRERRRVLSLVDEKPFFRQTPEDQYSRTFAESGFESFRG
ncbi:MAG: hypothetical protein ACK58L_19115 [Planctomycetota bacterium]